MSRSGEFTGEILFYSKEFSSPHKMRVSVGGNKKVTLSEIESSKTYQFDISDMFEAVEIFKIDKIKQLGQEVLKKVKNLVPNGR